MSAIQKISTRIPLQKFILIAKVSVASDVIEVIGFQKEKADAISPCQRYGIAFAVPLLPRRIPPLSAMTFGV